MSIKYVFFDLDGTLLPMDQELFSKQYFVGITKKFAPYGYDPCDVVNAIQNGIVAMVRNEGKKTNEEVCWRELVNGLGEGILGHKSVFEEFYQKDFDALRDACGYDERAKTTVSRLHGMGIKTILATNPLFPSKATEKRIEWSGVSKGDFEYVSVYENSRFSKPNPAYYTEILEKSGIDAADCLMVGNDVEEDMIAATIGMKTFLVTDQLISRKNIDISVFPNGNLDDLIEYVKKNI